MKKLQSKLDALESLFAQLNEHYGNENLNSENDPIGNALIEKIVAIKASDEDFVKVAEKYPAITF